MSANTLSTDETYDKTVFGFWLYLMSDCVIFGTLFATLIVLRAGYVDKELFSMPYVLTETMILLTSSFTCGLAGLAAYNKSKPGFLFWTALTFLLGAAFLGMELYEFNDLVQEGHSWTRNAYMSSYFTLVGTHGLHIAFGLLWMAILVPFVLKQGLHADNVRKITLFGLFWHFLDIIWIFIFTIVYLLGVSA